MSYIKHLRLIILLYTLCNLNHGVYLYANEVSNINPKSYFIENKGQVDPRVKFYCKLPDTDVWLTDNEIIFSYKNSLHQYEEKNDTVINHFNNNFDSYKNEFDKQQNIIFRFQNDSISSAFHYLKGVGKLDYYHNYILGKSNKKELKRVNLYDEVLIGGITSGIDMRLYFQNNCLRYDFIVHPLTNICNLKMIVEGVQEINSKDNILTLRTPYDTIEHNDLIAYQQINGKKNFVSVIQNQNNCEVTYQVGDYNNNYDLVIDPIIFSTFIHGNSGEIGNSITSDKGLIYFAGSTSSRDFPTTSNAFIKKVNNSNNAFFSVLSSNGSKLIYSTFFGSDSSECDVNAHKIKVINNKIYLSGYIEILNSEFNGNFPTTNNTYQQKLNIGYNYYIAIFDSLGENLIDCTIFNPDTLLKLELLDYEVDSSGYVYLFGEVKKKVIENDSYKFPTASKFPITKGVIQPELKGNSDFFITKFNPTLSNIIFSTFLGGSDDENSGTFICSSKSEPLKLDKNNNIYIVGNTFSSDYPITIGSIPKSFSDSSIYWALVITVIDSSGKRIINSSYFCDSTLSGNLCIDERSQTIYISGITEKMNFPITNGAFQNNFLPCVDRVYISKFDMNLTKHIASTFVGGSLRSYVYGMCIDKQSNINLIGNTWDIDFPITKDAIQPINHGYQDCICAMGDGIYFKLSSDLSKLIYSTYLGGSCNESGDDIFVDDNDQVYLLFTTVSHDLPTTPNSYYPKIPDYKQEDIAVVKLSTITDVNDIIGDRTNLFITPNPTSDYISINISEINRRVNPTVDKVEIYSIEGILMHSTSPQPSPFSERAIQLDVSGFVPGVYFVKIGDKVQRFVKM